MKRLFLFLLLSFPLGVLALKSYYVTVVAGVILRQNNSRVQVGEILLSNERLRLSSKRDFLIVMDSKARYRISLAGDESSGIGEPINLWVERNIHLHSDNVRLSSRAIDDGVSLADYFKTEILKGEVVNERILIVDVLKIGVGNLGYKDIDNQEKFFFLQLIDSGGRAVNRKLVTRKDSLLISKEDFIFNGKQYEPGDGRIILGFVEDYTGEKQINEISVISPLFATKQELLGLAHAIKAALANSSRDEVMKEIYTQLYFFYGKPDRALVEELYDS